MNSAKILLCVSVLTVTVVAAWSNSSRAQGAKMTVGQTGTNPGTSLFFIAEKE